MIDPNVDKNFLGTFKRLKDVLAAFPNGGQKGDYLYIGETLYRWDKWNLSWVSDSVISETKTKQIQKFDGEVDIDEELHVGGDAVFNEDIRVKGTAYISRVKQPNVGFFATLQELQEAYPNPTIGMWATVGSTMPAPVYRCDGDGVWSDTGTIGGIDPIERTYYYTREEADEAMRQTAKDEISKVNFSNNEYVDESVGALRDDINTQLGTLQEDLEDSINTLKTDTEEDLESLRDEIGSLSGYDDTAITNAISSLNEDFDALNDTVTIFKDLFDSLFEKDDANNAIKAKLSLYSVGGITAGGIGSGGSSGGGGSSTLAGLNDVSLKSETANDVLVYNGTHWVNTPMSSVKPDMTAYATKSWVEDKGYALNTALLKVDARLANVETIFEADQDGAINKWSEVVAFLDGIEGDTLDSILSQFATQQWVEENYLPIDGTAADAEKLGGEDPAHYATAAALTELSDDVTEFRTLFDSLFEKDTANNAIKAKLSLYSVGGITAGGIGSGGSSGGGGGASYNRLDAWTDYTNDKSGWVLSALLGKDLDTRVSALANAGYITASALDPYAKTADVAKTYATKTALQGVDIRVQAIEYIFEEDQDGVINKWQEIVNFLAGVEATTLDSILEQFATKTELSSYLPKTGGELTGNVLLRPTDASDVSISFISGSSADSYYDYKIGKFTDANGKSAFGIAMANDVGEWYKFFGISVDGLYNITSVDILSNTNISGNVTAPTFIGYLQGTADRANKISLYQSNVGLGAATYGDYGGFVQSAHEGPSEGTWYSRLKVLHDNSEGYYQEIAMPFFSDDLYYRHMNGGVLNDWVKIPSENSVKSIVRGIDSIIIPYTDGVVPSGWHRVAVTTRAFNAANNIRLKVARMWNNNPSEAFVVDISACYGKVVFSQVSGCAYNRLIDKIRVVGAGDVVAYIDVHFKSANTNLCYVTVRGTANILSTIEHLGDTDVDNQHVFSIIDGAAFSDAVTAPTFIGNLQGNADTATKLATARTIWGRTFDGTGNVDGPFRQLSEIYGDGELIHKTLVYPTNPFGLLTRAYISGCISLQSQRENNDSECFKLALNPLGGNVGIGTTNPAEKLDVAGNIKTSGSVRIGDAILSWDATNKCVTIKNANTGEKASLFVDGGVTGTAIN